MTTPIRFIAGFFRNQKSIAMVFILALTASGHVYSNDGNGQPPVFAVVELFTSEGCSSCPPGEETLADMRSLSFTDDLNVITIAWHVDYWDSLGWPDPYGSKTASDRQRHYAGQLNSSRYTPQTIIDGHIIADWAGDTAEIERIVRRRLRLPRPTALEARAEEEMASGKLLIEFSLENRRDFDIEVILVEDGLISVPDAGENRNRELRHSSTVRSNGQVAEGSDSVELLIPDSVNRARSSIVILVRPNGRPEIVAARQIDLPDTETGGIHGNVRYADGSPAADNVIQFCTDTLCIPIQSDATGSFHMTGLEPGNYQLKTGEISAAVNVTVYAGRTSEIDLVL